MFKRFIASLICVTFSFTNLQYVQAQDFSLNQLPVPGTMIGESVPFAPLALKGLIVNPQKPLEFQFIVDTGNGPQDTASVKDQANQLVKYFLAGLTIPEGDLWVNLSPYEKNRMVPEALGQTDLGRDLLAQDYILKQLTASLIYPEKDLGKEFWSRVYAKAQAQFGTTNIPVNTFNKVWILPDQAQVFENVNAAYVTKSTLKVMLDADYLARQKHQATKASSISSQIVREIVIPEITKEVNTGKNFAPLRQIYQALILAKWYKETIQNGLLDALYTNKNKIAGVNLNDPTIEEQIYNRYLQAYKKGAFNYIKEDQKPDGQVMPRRYFSGGTLLKIDHLNKTHDSAMITNDGGHLFNFTFVLVGAVSVAALGAGALYRGLKGKVADQSGPQKAVVNLIKKMKAAEDRKDYQEYNRLSDSLHDMGNPQGDFHYEDRGILNEPWNRFAWESDWHKVKRGQESLSSDEAMLSQEERGYIENMLDSMGLTDKERGSARAIATEHLRRLKQREKIDWDKDKDKWLGRLQSAYKWWVEDRPNYTYKMINWFGEGPLKNVEVAKATGQFRQLMEDEVTKTGSKFFIYSGGSGVGKSTMWSELTSTADGKKFKKFLIYATRERRVDEDPVFRHDFGPEDNPDLYKALDLILKGFGSWDVSKVNITNIGQFKAGLEAALKPIGLSETSRSTLDKILDLKSIGEQGRRVAIAPEKRTGVNAQSWEISLAERLAYLPNGRIRVFGEFDGVTYYFITLAELDDLVSKGLARKFETPGVKPQGISFEELKSARKNQEGKIYVLEAAPDIANAIKQEKGNEDIVTFFVSPFDNPSPLSEIDSAMLETPKVEQPIKDGGIDLNQIDVLRNGRTVNVQFDPAQLNQLEQGGFGGFTPVIINMTRISSPFQLLGISTT